MTREERIKRLAKLNKIPCPICGRELEDLLEYEQTSDEYEHQYYCNYCLIEINIDEEN